jgi:S1-C subfamily serine protease
VWLRVLSGADAGRTVELPEPGRPFILGRVQGCDLVIRDERASRQHAELRVEPAGGVRVIDLGSANGTFVDGRKVGEALLAGGEELRIAGVEIAVLARRPASEGGDGPPPSWSLVGRLVDSRTRGARRATWAALGAALLALVAVAVVLLVGGGSSQEDDAVPQVVKQVTPSTVLVEALRDGRRTATGTGWVLDAHLGLIVTAGHVVNQGERFRVGADGQARPAEVLGVAPCEDLALLGVKGLTGLKEAEKGESSELEQGQTVVALGYQASALPSDEVTSTRGVVSAAHTAFRDPSPDVPAYPDAVQTDTALNPGFSGGPLVDLDGRVIGVNAAARTTGSDGRPLEGQNYAIAIDRARGVIADLRLGRSTDWTGATLGYPTTQELAERRLPAGLYLTGAVPGTPAAKAGLGGTGEVLVGVDGRRVGTTLQSYCNAMGNRQTTKSVRLTLARPGGKTRDVRIPLA